jgi:hypothetical protein
MANVGGSGMRPAAAGASSGIVGGVRSCGSVDADESTDELDDAGALEKMLAKVELADDLEWRDAEAEAEAVADLALRCEAMPAGRAGTGGAEGATGMSSALRRDLMLR